MANKDLISPYVITAKSGLEQVKSFILKVLNSYRIQFIQFARLFVYIIDKGQDTRQ